MAPSYSFERNRREKAMRAKREIQRAAKLAARRVSGRSPQERGYDPTSCAELFCAVIGQAIKDLELVERLETKPNLSGYEAKKLLRLIADDHPAVFLEGDWFEQICGMLDIEPETIRLGVRARRADGAVPVR